MIRHTVVFKLKHAAGSEEERDFLKAALILDEIPSVRNFEQLRQVSQKNDFDFGFSMEFESQEGYTAYNEHPDHVAFVQDRWIPEVADFLEIDYVAYEGS
ncbi:MAG: Dabb family protein [Puniceicoccaceae bacterium]